MIFARPAGARWRPVLPALVLALIAVAGFAWVKWLPYYAKAFVAHSQGSIGNSILADASGAIPAASWQAALDYALRYGASIWQAMLLGLVLGAGIKVLVPASRVSALLGQLGLRSSLLGSALALPCMMCTCCAAPVAAGLRRQQASVGSVVAWWLANPVLNPATLVFMGFVLGWDWAALRVLLGCVMVIGIAWLAERMSPPQQTTGVDAVAHKLERVQQATAAPASVGPEHTSGLLQRWLREFLQLSLRIIPEYLVLVLLLGAARAWLFPVAAVDDTLLWIVVLALAGTLFVIPTAAEVPIVQTLLALGGGVGPAAALLMTLPAVSLPSLLMLGGVLPRRSLLVIGLAVLAIGVLAGLLAPWLI